MEVDEVDELDELDSDRSVDSGQSRTGLREVSARLARVSRTSISDSWCHEWTLGVAVLVLTERAQEDEQVSVHGGEVAEDLWWSRET